MLLLGFAGVHRPRRSAMPARLRPLLGDGRLVGAAAAEFVSVAVELYRHGERERDLTCVDAALLVAAAVTGASTPGDPRYVTGRQFLSTARAFGFA